MWMIHVCLCYACVFVLSSLAFPCRSLSWCMGGNQVEVQHVASPEKRLRDSPNECVQLNAQQLISLCALFI